MSTWHEELITLWRAAGAPSSREISRRCDNVSHSTVSQMMRGIQPSRAKLQLVVRVLGGSWATFEPLLRETPDTHPDSGLRHRRASDLLEDILDELKAIRLQLGKGQE